MCVCVCVWVIRGHKCIRIFFIYNQFQFVLVFVRSLPVFFVRFSRMIIFTVITSVYHAIALSRTMQSAPANDTIEKTNQ